MLHQAGGRVHVAEGRAAALAQAFAADEQRLAQQAARGLGVAGGVDADHVRVSMSW